ncbi:MAG TPA: type I methionyl aminopeptidase [bacterium]|jgi:methionyl aminopeptidase|nr:type I methionyl aminopeptidase [bacterium]HNT65358.1 type I methionyl aminopeptidase [bacterium]HOX86526.1 type I methionyl aminopeptidase [bacterium]HPG46552.1 type I methionyl aminopeptidase [bacterium]HPM98392.1 type I methionyl aminopeptidase [bacterium]
MIAIRTAAEIEKIAHSALLVSEALDLAGSVIKPGMTTREIDAVVDDLICSRGARPAFKGFNGYPAASCISIDEEVVHGIPGDKVIREGQIVSVDIGVEWEGYYGDAARTFSVGAVSAEKQRLMDVTLTALLEGVDQAREGNRLYDIGYAIQNKVEEAGFSVVRDLVGHGIGQSLHEPPQIPNYGHPHRGARLCSGMVFAIEPMVNMGTWEVETLEDGWTVITADRLPSAHFEHTIVITEGDPIILSKGN